MSPHPTSASQGTEGIFGSAGHATWRARWSYSGPSPHSRMHRWPTAKSPGSPIPSEATQTAHSTRSKNHLGVASRSFQTERPRQDQWHPKVNIKVLKRHALQMGKMDTAQGCYCWEGRTIVVYALQIGLNIHPSPVPRAWRPQICTLGVTILSGPRSTP